MSFGYRLAVVTLGVGCVATTAKAESEANAWMPWNTTSAKSAERPAAAERIARRVERPERVSRPVALASRPVAVTQSEPRAVGSYQPSERLALNADTTSLGPRPTQWCGWYMRSLRGGGPEFNVAANWRSYGSPGQPQVGAIVVWDHHVGLITGRTESGEWIVKSGNWSNSVHEGPRSIAGATVRV